MSRLGMGSRVLALAIASTSWAQVTQRVSVSSTGEQGIRESYYPVLSADGRYVAFSTASWNLVPGDTNGSTDVFVRDRLNATTERVSVGAGEVQGNGTSYVASISADGRDVAFMSSSNNLVPGDTNGLQDAFVRDRQNGTTERVSVDSGGVQANATIEGPTGISADGRFVAFWSAASNLVPGDTNAVTDVFVRDRQLGTTERVSFGAGGVQGNAECYPSFISVSTDGRYVAFWSEATNLVPGDSNGYSDTFVHDRLGEPNFTSLCDPGVGGVIPCPCGNAPSGLGRGCDNSSTTGGAVLTAEGGTYLSSDSLVFTTSAERPTAFSLLLQGNVLASNGVVHGQGVWCAAGSFKRLYRKSASAGSITVPDFGGGDSSVSAMSAAKGDVIQPAQSRWYLVYYRDPTVLGGCPRTSTLQRDADGYRHVGSVEIVIVDGIRRNSDE